MTATPFHNHIRDLLGLTHLLSTKAIAQLKSFIDEDEGLAQKVQDLVEGEEPFVPLSFGGEIGDQVHQPMRPVYLPFHPGFMLCTIESHSSFRAAIKSAEI